MLSFIVSPVKLIVLAYSFNEVQTVVKGKLQVGDDAKAHDKFNLLVLSAKPGESGVALTRPADDTGAEEAHFVVIAGKPLDQPIVQVNQFIICKMITY